MITAQIERLVRPGSDADIYKEQLWENLEGALGTTPKEVIPVIDQDPLPLEVQRILEEPLPEESLGEKMADELAGLHGKSRLMASLKALKMGIVKITKQAKMNRKTIEEVEK